MKYVRKGFAGRLVQALVLLLFSGVAYGQIDYAVGATFSHPLQSGGTGPDMVVLREGRYVFGGGREEDDPDALVVEFSRPFAISRTEITAGMYRKFLQAAQSGELRDFDIEQDELPVHGISWDDAEAYATWLSLQTGYHYSLPSTTQWEYAARAGSRKLYSWGDKVGEGRANCRECGAGQAGQIAPVASFQPNGWGLFDMHGNVWEWTKDCMDRNSKPPRNGMPQLFGNCDSREIRGGSASSDAWSIRINSRMSARRGSRHSDVGFRVVMELPH